MNKNNQVDAVVIGCGVAGSVAAARLTSLGYKVVVVHRSAGASSYSSGAVDIADSESTNDIFERGETWYKSLRSIQQTDPEHPYHFLPNKSTELEAAIDLLKHLVSDVELQERDDSCNFVLATQAGTVKRSALVQKSLAFDLISLGLDSRVGVVDLSGYLQFEAQPVAAMLQWVLRLRKHCSANVIPVRINFAPESGNWSSLVSVAHALEKKENQIKLVQALKESLAKLPVKPDHLFFPAMMGFNKPNELLEVIQNETAVGASELLAMPTSVPGIRLSNALFSGLNLLNIECIQGDVSGFSLDAGKIKSLSIKKSGEESFKYEPKAVILATGKALAGGFKLEGETTESIFKLPLWSDKGPVLSRFPMEMTNPGFAGDHEIFKIGLAADELQRPLNKFGELFANNLFAAGSILRGYDPAKNKTGLGAAALLGFEAAQSANANLLKKVK